jgi:hypothetical protein
MKTYIFKRESNSFDDIIQDNILKKMTRTKVRWTNYLMIAVDIRDGKIESYINLKYGDSIIPELVKDRSPVPLVDYMPKKN